MSLFDPPNEDRLSDVFPIGTPFMLYEVEYEGIRSTSFGDSAQASVLAGPADRSVGEPARYKVWGNLADQTRNVKGSDLPALVMVQKVGNRHQWAPAERGGSTEDVPF